MRSVERTRDTEEHPCSSQTTAVLIPILEHFEHRAHLLTTVDRFVLNGSKLILRRPVYLDDTMARVGCIGGNDVET